jgi:hypothetical protein
VYIINEGTLSNEINSDESSEKVIQNYFLKSAQISLNV